MKNSFHIFANAALGKGLSGSDRIFIEFAKILRNKFSVVIHVWREGYEMCISQNLRPADNLHFYKINADPWCKYGFFICYIARIILSIKSALLINTSDKKKVILYSASEFWMDSLPAFILKLRSPKAIWIACWFQTAPNFIKGFTSGNRERSYKLSAFYYWLVQLPIKPLLNTFADVILVNNESEREQFPRLNRKNKVLVSLGAVNVFEINKFIKKFGKTKKTYDAVFQGRFHPQKGVVELIDIWKLVTEKIPEAKLVMVGDGPLMNKVRFKIAELSLQNNIELVGYLFDGPKKYKIFVESKVVVHPAFYDSGGMAAAEAMAFGLPCVGFNLEAYDSYYPKGMVKVEIGNLMEFSKSILELISNSVKRENIGNEAQKMILENWSWEKRCDQLIGQLKMEKNE